MKKSKAVCVAGAALLAPLLFVLLCLVIFGILTALHVLPYHLPPWVRTVLIIALCVALPWVMGMWYRDLFDRCYHSSVTELESS